MLKEIGMELLDVSVVRKEQNHRSLHGRLHKGFHRMIYSSTLKRSTVNMLTSGWVVYPPCGMFVKLGARDVRDLRVPSMARPCTSGPRRRADASAAGCPRRRTRWLEREPLNVEDVR